MEGPQRNGRRYRLQCQHSFLFLEDVNEEPFPNTQKAIKAGYRLFDGAYDYQNEKEAGEGIRRAIADGLVTRDQIFITTKLWNNYHRRQHALAMAKKQNEAWGLGYIDLFLMHFPCALKYIDPAMRQYPVRNI